METGSFERHCTTGEFAPAVAAAAFYGGIGAFIGHRRKTVDWSDAALQDWQPAPSALSWRVSPTLSHEARGAGLRLQLSW